MGIRFNLHQDQGRLVVLLDLADRKVVGWALSETMEAETTTVAAWQMAIKNRPLFHSLLFHSDRGVQYACSAFREQLEGMLVVQSMSRKGNCSRQCSGRELL